MNWKETGVPSSIFGQISSIDSLDNLRTLNYLVMVFSHSKRCQFHSVIIRAQ